MNTTITINDIESSNQTAPEASASPAVAASVSLTLPLSLDSEEVLARYWAECRKHEERMQASAAMRSAMLAVFEDLEVKELTMKGLLHALKDQVPNATEEMVKGCCAADPEMFEFLPPQGLRRATVRRVVEKREKSPTSEKDLAENVEAVVKAITNEPHQGAPHYRTTLGIDKATWEKARDTAIKEKKIGKNGERSNTTYFPIAA